MKKVSLAALLLSFTFVAACGAPADEKKAGAGGGGGKPGTGNGPSGSLFNEKTSGTVADVTELEGLWESSLQLNTDGNSEALRVRFGAKTVTFSKQCTTPLNQSVYAQMSLKAEVLESGYDIKNSGLDSVPYSHAGEDYVCEIAINKGGISKPSMSTMISVGGFILTKVKD